MPNEAYASVSQPNDTVPGPKYAFRKVLKLGPRKMANASATPQLEKIKSYLRNSIEDNLSLLLIIRSL